ncbi:uncharacterized protein DS421_11g328330 [Arachis hypogaea]|nr:uncharacterized protein DS421_11g328330 [Arachis hypogaea]
MVLQRWLKTAKVDLEGSSTMNEEGDVNAVYKVQVGAFLQHCKRLARVALLMVLKKECGIPLWFGLRELGMLKSLSVVAEERGASATPMEKLVITVLVARAVHQASRHVAKTPQKISYPTMNHRAMS